MSRQRVSQHGVMKRAGIRRVTSWLVAIVLVSMMGGYPAMAQLPEGISPEVAERFMSMSTRQQWLSLGSTACR